MIDTEYDSFLKSKVRLAQPDGFECSIEEINPALKPHNKLMVKWLVEGGTVPLRAIKKGRRGYGIELNPVHFLDGAGYLKSEELKRNVPTLFDLINKEVA